MSFLEIARSRQSCRNFDNNRRVEEEKLSKILEAARLSPSACNSQPYHLTVCKGETAKMVAKATMGMGMNKFADKAPIMIVVSEDNYNKTAAMGAKFKDNDYRSIDIGIVTAYLTSEAQSLGVGSCILGWFDDNRIQKIINTDKKTRLVIALGYPKEGEVLRSKKRKPFEKLVTDKP